MLIPFRDSHKVVYEVLEYGESCRVPLQVESDNKDYESRFGDIVGFRAKIRVWESFYIRGGPFQRRDGERLLEWSDRVDPSQYTWPDSDEILYAIEEYKQKSIKYAKERFTLFKVLGPTETSESFFTRPLPSNMQRLNQIMHRFDFALFLKVNPRKALKVYDRIASVILELIKAGCELDFVDAIRIADDVAGYSGPLYPAILLKRYIIWHRKFTEIVHRSGKWVFLHCDGDIRKRGLLTELSNLYDGIHPLDFRPKSTLKDAIYWIKEIGHARETIGKKKPVFFTGLPIDLIFNVSITSKDLLQVVKNLIKFHGKEWLILATTHSPYPGRSYSEKEAREKILFIRRSILEGRI